MKNQDDVWYLNGRRYHINVTRGIPGSRWETWYVTDLDSQDKLELTNEVFFTGSALKENFPELDADDNRQS